MKNTLSSSKRQYLYFAGVLVNIVPTNILVRYNEGFIMLILSNNFNTKQINLCISGITLSKKMLVPREFTKVLIVYFKLYVKRLCTYCLIQYELYEGPERKIAWTGYLNVPSGIKGVIFTLEADLGPLQHPRWRALW